MLEPVVAVLGTVLLLLGLLLASVGLYGMLRKPTIFEQLHAAALVTGPGVILVLLASVATGHAESITSALLVVAFILVTSSLSTHAIALAAWRQREAATIPASGSGAMVGSEGGWRDSPRAAAMRVLVAHDGSPGADPGVGLVAALSWPAGSVVRVVGAVEGDLPGLAASSSEPNREPAQLAAALEAAERLLVRPGLTVDRVVRRGSPAQAIVDEAIAFDAQLVIVGSRGLGRVRTLLVGSVAAEVVDDAPCPVLIAHSTSLGQVLLAVDGSEPAAIATEAVARWPIFDGTTIHVLSVAPAGPEDAEAPGSAGRPETVKSGPHQQVADEAATRLRDAGRSAVARARPGDPADAIVAFAAEEAVDLIVLGSRGRTGLRRALLGSVARDVVSSAAASVLVVRARDGKSERPGWRT